MKSSKSILGALALGLLGVTLSTSAFAAPAPHLRKVCAQETASDAALKAAREKFNEVRKAENAADAALKAARQKERETDILRAQATLELAKAIAAERALDSKEARAIAAARRRVMYNDARIGRLEAEIARLEAYIPELKATLVKEKNGQAETCAAPQLDPANKDKYTLEDIKEAEQACKEDKGEVSKLEDKIANAEKALAAARATIVSAKAQNVRLQKLIDVCKDS